MTTVYLICFVLGLVLSLLSVFGLGRLHIGHLHVHGPHLRAHQAGAFNGFTLAAFLLWFGAAGYLLEQHSAMLALFVVAIAIAIGLVGAAILYAVLFKFLLPRERVLTLEDTRMEGTLARISDEVRAVDGIGEVIFSQAGVRRAAPARSEGGLPLARGTEVVVLRYERGIATVRPLHELSPELAQDSSQTTL